MQQHTVALTFPAIFPHLRKLITCRRGSSKRAKITVALKQIYNNFIHTYFYPNSVHIQINQPTALQTNPHHQLYLNPSHLLPQTRHSLQKSPPPNLSLLRSTKTTRSAPSQQFPETHLPLAGMSPRPSHAPARRLPPPQILEPHSTASHELLPRSDCTAVLPSLSGEGKG